MLEVKNICPLRVFCIQGIVTTKIRQQLTGNVRIARLERLQLFLEMFFELKMVDIHLGFWI